MISVCEKGKELQRAVGLFGELQRQGMTPNVITYNAMITACDKGRRPEQALELLEQMQRRGV